MQKERQDLEVFYIPHRERQRERRDRDRETDNETDRAAEREACALLQVARLVPFIVFFPKKNGAEKKAGTA